MLGIGTRARRLRVVALPQAVATGTSERVSMLEYAQCYAVMQTVRDNVLASLESNEAMIATSANQLCDAPSAQSSRQEAHSDPPHHQRASDSEETLVVPIGPTLDMAETVGETLGDATQPRRASGPTEHYPPDALANILLRVESTEHDAA